MQEPDSLRCGLVAVVGRANVGKSTLLNAALGEKVSIVSPVAQTTRACVRGILTEARGQIAFLDTPGVHKAEYDLGRLMNRVARSSIEGTDLVLLVLDASVEARREDEGWMRRLITQDTPVVAVLNKCDHPKLHRRLYEALWARVAAEKQAAKTADWLEVSALDGRGVPELVGHLFSKLSVGPMLFPDDVLTDFPRKLGIADVVREKYFEILREELPHALAVEIEEVEERADGWSARGTIFVEKNSQKGIVLGNKGRLLKSVKQKAEKDLAEMYGHPVSLELWVKVEPGWTRNFWMLKRLGYAP